MPQLQQNFLEEYVLRVLRQSGFEKLSEENKKELLPQFTVEAQRRIGAAIGGLLGWGAGKALSR